jgi:hypothetical protein
MDLLADTYSFIAKANEGDLEQVSWSELRAEIARLTMGFPIVVQSLDAESSVVSRARRLTDGEEIRFIGQIGPPSSQQSVGYGRCNRPDRPFLYSGANTPLLLSEIGVGVGDRVCLAHLKLARDAKLLNLGAIDLYRRTSGYCMLDEKIKEFIANSLLSSSRGVRIPLMDAFVADYFSRPGGPMVYKLTSAFTDVVLSGAPKLDGIVYDSVSHRGGKCFGFRGSLFPATVLPAAVQIVTITANHGYGIYDFVEDQVSDVFSGNEIVWSRRSAHQR